MAGPGEQSYVREFTRHASDVLMNLNELRKRCILTDVTLRVGGCPLHAHKAVLTACSGFFYSIFLGQGGHQVSVLTLPSSIEPAGFQAILDFMYTSRLLLTPGTVPAVLAAASYLQMEHVAESCHRFIQASYDRVSSLLTPPTADFLHHHFQTVEDPSADHLQRRTPDSPIPAAVTAALPAVSYSPKDKPYGSFFSPGNGSQSPPGWPASPRGSSTPDPKACNWKKYKFIILNSRMHEDNEEEEEGRLDTPKSPDHMDTDRNNSGTGQSIFRRTSPALPRCSVCNRDSFGVVGRGSYHCGGFDLPILQEDIGGPSPPTASDSPPEKPYKCHFCSSGVRYKGNLASHRTLHTGDKPYHCGICGAQFNRPANLKTHLRIHSGEKPYKCETCGSRFVQVAHLRAHVLIHTGEKPYPCGTCGTRFRHLQTLKSHIRIHTGEKPYQCEKCNIRFRHKSQLRLHLRQKHGAVTNTKVRYKVLDGPYATLC
ncbi:B-cell CLL/lymphoma 6 member B protein [Anolis carolinensis]|uniref:B-cell CLL/lymphoma 6 member B protein n=1 Tax=Anolis carolinensis TaxID=28377 RepID=UPI002F2B3A90